MVACLKENISRTELIRGNVDGNNEQLLLLKLYDYKYCDMSIRISLEIPNPYQRM